METGKFFFSYARADSEFVLKLAADLRSNGTNVWLDRLDIPGGARWDRAVEEALHASPCLLVVLSPASVASNNVMDEVSFGLENEKRIVPILFKDCPIPFRLKRLQYIDFRAGYDEGFARLVQALKPVDQLPTPPSVGPIPETRRPSGSESGENQLESASVKRFTAPPLIYGIVAAGVVVIIVSVVVWWPKRQEAPVKEAGFQKEAIKEAPIVEPQPPKEIVASAPEKKLEAEKEIIRHPPVVKVQPKTRSETTPQKKAEGQREIPPGPSIATADPKKKAIPDYSETRGQIAGRWEGRYQCQGEEIGFSLHITNEDGNHVAAIFEFFPLPERVSFPRGSFRMVGDYNRKDGNLRLQSAAWIQRPLGFQSHNLEGQIEANGTTISGRVLTAGCAHFMLTRK